MPEPAREERSVAPAAESVRAARLAPVAESVRAARLAQAAEQ
jgi:hypothetical protein